MYIKGIGCKEFFQGSLGKTEENDYKIIRQIPKREAVLSNRRVGGMQNLSWRLI